MLVETPPPFAPEAFTDAAAAVARLEEIYARNTRFLRDRFEAYVKGEALTARVRASYPFVRVTTATHARLDSRLAYGFVASPGVHETSVTRPDLFRTYLTEQIGLLIENHRVPVEIGELNEPIPIHFAYRRDINIEAALPIADSSALTDRCATCSTRPTSPPWTMRSPTARCSCRPARREPLALFRAARVDYSLRRLYHYTGTDPEHFQNFVIFTNYQFYIDAFVQLCRERMAAGELGAEAFVEPGNVITRNARFGGGTTGSRPSACRRCRPFISSSPAIAASP